MSQLLRLDLNRPKALNALNNDMIADLKKLFTSFGADPKIRVIVLEGEGDVLSVQEMI